MQQQIAITKIEKALARLGVTEDTLTESEKKSLDERGYLIFTGLIIPEWMERLRERFETLMEKEGSGAGLEVHQEGGTRRLADLVNKGDAFDGIYTHPKVLAAAYHVLGREFKMSSLNSRDALPGHGHQGFHQDTVAARNVKEPFVGLQSQWMVDELTVENGATRIVPGSHLLPGSPKDYMKNTTDPHPEQMLVLAPAGSVLVFNAHLWHGGTVNRSDKNRRVFHCFFTGREHDQQTNQREYIRKATYERISPAARYILDVDYLQKEC